jgi:ribonuclease Z
MSSMRDHYFPNTEPIAANEMRIIALGTGRPFVRRAQANCSWLIELGNGDKFIMDFGSGSQVNFTALEIPHQDVTAYFATHLHTDHVGDFAQVWIGSWTGGRIKPLVVYGPSGPEPKYGTRHFVHHQMESCAWDTDTRLGLLPDAGAEVEVNEFDYRQTAVVYDRNDVVIKSFPAVHIYDGPVSYRLEWNGLTFVFSGDTTPSQFFVDNAQGADLLIHECFNTVTQLIERSGYDEKSARGIGTMAHTAPEEAGRVLALVKPRLAVVFHCLCPRQPRQAELWHPESRLGQSPADGAPEADHRCRYHQYPVPRLAAGGAGTAQERDPAFSHRPRRGGELSQGGHAHSAGGCH